MIQPGRKYTIDDHRRMQLDALTLRAQPEIPLFTRLDVGAAGRRTRPRDARERGTRCSRATAPRRRCTPTWRGGVDARRSATPRGPLAERQPQHEASLARAIEQLTTSQGADWSALALGPHAHARRSRTRSSPAFNLPTVERPGGTGTVAADGASYREILDVADWDRSIVTNVPGQSAQPESPFYGNLLKLWADDVYFPLVYSKERVEKETAHRMTLRPAR